ncbi:PREDICTED: inter-alpha-trypsin inhibitor heavy chain H3-like isoform X2 [Nicrophorus vespilloides]|uniref:Inter-alpha-trypsin inhibitor heavy chain H3-like isoform X2 n=1 Tax=Nicrophorus vespilloides TaxID=110193 RepID=A0ABM1MXW2_NICVS|nr:PREDICTED: inter-alpha-trypsin inhibitor heavy chain H3-like isoform X2 [Nicrophorus vespilloides]
MVCTVFKIFALAALTASCIVAIPVDKDMVVVTDVPNVTFPTKEGNTNQRPQISEMNIKTNVTNRFAQTTVTSKVKNHATKSQEAVFFVVLPDQAFISAFIMEIDGKNYTAYVQEKEKAKKTYEDAVSSGIGAAHVAVSARDSNKFTVNVNIEPESKAVFYLTYEELLERKKGFYELVINIHPGQLVKDLNVEVDIDESRALSFVKAPQIRSGNEILKENDELDPRAQIDTPKPEQAVIKFKPDYEKQKRIAHGLGTKEDEGLSGQFIVQYDVERDQEGGEILVKDGYFVHFFAPPNLKPLVKHVVFVLDTSGSMYGRRIEQLKEAMKNILGDLNPEDYFNLVEFNSNVKVWNLDAPEESTTFPNDDNLWGHPEKVHEIKDVSFPPAYPVKNTTINKANKAVMEMHATGGTNIYEAIRVGIHLIKLRQKRVGNNNIQPLIIFLTDGEATVGKVSENEIIAGVSDENSIKIPIVSLSFGDSADRKMLKKLSQKNFGFERTIYEDSDSDLQLQNFYKEISSPLLNNIKFTYTPDTVSLTRTDFPILYQGGELVVSGRIPENVNVDKPIVSCFGILGPVLYRPKVKKSVGQLERLWAYMTVKKLLGEKETSTNATEIEKKALDLALKYSFVTPVTSMVVVKPNSTKSVDTEEASSSPDYAPGAPLNVGFGGSFKKNIGYRKFNTRTRPGIALSRPFLSAPAPQYPLLTSTLAQQYPLATVLPGSTYQPSYDRVATGFAMVPNHVFELDSDEGVINHTEAFSTTTMKPFVVPAEIKTKLPWMETKFNVDGTLTFFKGHYTLGLNETSPAGLDCTDPQSEEGFCMLVKDCEILLPKLIDEQSFKDYFCSIENKFAGVCCPKKK